MDPRALYVEHLEVINRIAESLCRRNGIRGADAEDFVSEVRLKLLQDDYAVLRKFRGTSSTTTFLTVVISNLFRDHRIKEHDDFLEIENVMRDAPTIIRTYDTLMHLVSHYVGCRLIRYDRTLPGQDTQIVELIKRKFK
jgi:DNA-directed RNA polymerase specialized sigma24 family protein